MPGKTCAFCEGTRFPGVHLPSDFDDRPESADGKVFVARCDACFLDHAAPSYASDTAAAAAVSEATGWPVHKSYDYLDSLDEAQRLDAWSRGRHWYRPYFAVTVKEAAAAQECNT